VKRTQQDRILDYLATGKPLTPIMALRRFGTFRLGARIYDLKREGHRITSELVSRNGARVAQYRLVRS
jgi:hypothetical protein